MKNLSIFLFVIFAFHFIADGQTISRLSDMPEAVTNQAVTYAEADGRGYVYSFAGIDETKIYTGIHQKAFKYDIQNDSWEQIASLPNGNGRIAAGASFVKGKIYIIGGYEVFEDDSEISVDLVHVYDPSTDTYLPDATPIPVPIDDHIQAVWRDSLIYIVTGWSNTTNVPDVQIYNPSNDEWQAGTSVPDNNTYKVFGSSGVIVGDTIYYAGGAKISGGAFGFSNVIRKGVINPDNPLEITWTHRSSFDAIGYRMGAASWDAQIPLWLGGSEDAYNFDGISYNTGEGVDPYERVLELNTNTDGLRVLDLALPIMDNREVAQIGPREVIVCGGIGPGQVVTNNTYLIDVNFVSTNSAVKNDKVIAYPSPTDSRLFLEGEMDGANFEIYDTQGILLLQGEYSEGGVNVSQLIAGIYQIRLFDIKTKKDIGTRQFAVK